MSTAPRAARRAAGRAATIAAAAGVAASRADAHLVSTELGPFYDGALHPLVSPEDLLLIVAVAALGALRGVDAARRGLVALLVGWTIGAAAGFALPIEPPAPRLVTAGLLLLLGGAAALGRPPRARVLGPLACAAAALHGIENGAAARAADGDWLAVAGILTGVLVVASLSCATGARVERAGGSFALRVAGSWTAAIGLLLAGWELASAAG